MVWSLALILLPAMMMGQRDTAAVAMHSFSVLQAVDYATKNNVQVKNALLDVRLQEQTNRDLTSAAYPQVNGNFSVVDNIKLPLAVFDPGAFSGNPTGTLIKVPFGIKYNTTAGVNLDQLLFDGQVFVGLQARQTAVDFAQKNVEVTETMIHTNIYKVYYQLVASKVQIAILDANIQRIAKQLSDTREIFKNGFAEKLDVDKVSVQLANVQTEKTKVINQINNGYLGLKLLLGMPMRDSLVLTDTISYERIVQDLPSQAEFKYSDRKEFQYAELGIKLNQYNIRRYKLSRWPTLSLNAYYNGVSQQSQFNFFKGGQWFPVSALTFRVNVPIFKGFSTRAKIETAQLDLQKSINQREMLKISIDNDISTASNSFSTAINTLNNQKQNMDLATAIYDQTIKKFDSGVGSTLEISNAQADLRIAQTNYISAMYDAIIAKIDYMRAVGKL